MTDREEQSTRLLAGRSRGDRARDKDGGWEELVLVSVHQRIESIEQNLPLFSFSNNTLL